MNTVSGRTNLWGLLEEYEPLNVLHLWYKGLFSGFGAEIDKNDQKYHLRVHFAQFHFIKLRNEYIFW